MRRVLIGISQEKLGEALGVTFQQVQKYEKGANRVSASRLQLVAQMLGAPVSFFFDGAPSGEPASREAGMAAGEDVPDFLATAEGVQLTKAFLRIKDSRIRRSIINLVEAAAEAPAT